MACGGCDTISSYEEIYELVRQAHDQGHDVLYEGLLISGEAARPINLHQTGYAPLHTIVLTTPIDVCISSINQRRWAKSPDKPPVKEKNTVAKARAVELASKRLEEAGMEVHRCDRDQAFEKIRELLKI